MSKVKVTVNPVSGQVITLSNNGQPSAKDGKQYGYIRLEQSTTSVDGNGWARQSKKSTLIKGSVETLQSFGFMPNQELPGKLFVKEQTTPFRENQQAKLAGNTTVVCKVGGLPIYRETFYDATGTAVDTLVAHDNHDEIKAAQANVIAQANATTIGE
jgi:hypothetical protein